jgi:hypothetical protein
MPVGAGRPSDCSTDTGAGGCPVLARLLRLVDDLRPLGADPLLARRHRRQYADDAGPRPAHGQGWFDPRQHRLNPPGRREHPLVAAGRPADRRADPAVAPLLRRRRRRALGGRDRADAAAAAAMFSLALTARRLVDPAPSLAPSPCSSPARPTACSCPSGSTITAGSSPCSRWRSPRCRSQAARGGAHARHRDRSVAGDRARDADLSRALGGAIDGAVLGRATRRARRLAPMRHAGRRTALGFLVFASYANRLPVCDALSPVWLSDGAARRRADAARLGSRRGAGSGGARRRRFGRRGHRRASAWTWPHCLGRLEGARPSSSGCG